MELGRLDGRHWPVEDDMHWALDMALGEDRVRTAGHAGEDPGLIRRVAAALLRQDP